MNRIYIIASFIAIVTIVSCGQKNENQLIGTWERVEEVKQLPQVQTRGSNSSNKIEVLLCFKDNVNIKIKQGPRIIDAKYKQEVNQLTIGNRKYQIVKLDSDSLILTDNRDWQPKTIKYFRTTKSIEE